MATVCQRTQWRKALEWIWPFDSSGRGPTGGTRENLIFVESRSEESNGGAFDARRHHWLWPVKRKPVADSHTSSRCRCGVVEHPTRRNRDRLPADQHAAISPASSQEQLVQRLGSTTHALRPDTKAASRTRFLDGWVTSNGPPSAIGLHRWRQYRIISA